jgi:hypothetical protein
MRGWAKRSAGCLLAATLAIGMVSTVRAADIADCPQDETCPLSRFEDADAAASYHDSLHYCLENGILRGTSQQRLEPNQNITCGMAAVILYRIEGCPDAAGDSSAFSDTPTWAQDAMCWASEIGILTESDGIAATDPITWDQFLTMVSRYESCKGQEPEIPVADTGSAYVTRAMAADFFYDLSMTAQTAEPETPAAEPEPTEPETDPTQSATVEPEPEIGTEVETDSESESGSRLWIPLTVGIVLLVVIGAAFLIRWRNRVDDTPMVDYNIDEDE